MWRYEADEHPKRRHHWEHDYAGFVQVGAKMVGKCPNNLTNEEAEALLTEGIPYYPARWRQDDPQRIYAVKDGVIYRAMPTNPGRSYHGFPELPDRFRELPAKLKRKVMERAEPLGCWNEVSKWLKG